MENGEHNVFYSSTSSGAKEGGSTVSGSNGNPRGSGKIAFRTRKGCKAVEKDKTSGHDTVDGNSGGSTFVDQVLGSGDGTKRDREEGEDTGSTRPNKRTRFSTPTPKRGKADGRGVKQRGRSRFVVDECEVGSRDDEAEEDGGEDIEHEEEVEEPEVCAITFTNGKDASIISYKDSTIPRTLGIAEACGNSGGPGDINSGAVALGETGLQHVSSRVADVEMSTDQLRQLNRISRLHSAYEKTIAQWKSKSNDASTAMAEVNFDELCRARDEEGAILAYCLGLYAFLNVREVVCNGLKRFGEKELTVVTDESVHEVERLRRDPMFAAVFDASPDYEKKCRSTLYKVPKKYEKQLYEAVAESHKPGNSGKFKMVLNSVSKSFIQDKDTYAIIDMYSPILSFVALPIFDDEGSH